MQSKSQRAALTRANIQAAQTRRRQAMQLRRKHRNPLGSILGGPIGFDSPEMRLGGLADKLPMRILNGVAAARPGSLSTVHSYSFRNPSIDITTSASAAVDVTLPSTHDSMKIWFDGVDLETYPHAWMYVYVTHNATTYQGLIGWRDGFVVKGLTAGGTVSIEVYTHEGTRVASTLSVSTCITPTEVQGTGSNAISGTITPDQCVPGLSKRVGFIPRIQLASEGQTIRFDWSSGTRQLPIYVVERNGNDEMPAQKIMLVPGQKSFVYCRFREIAVWCADQISVSVQAPSDATIDTTTARAIINFRDNFTRVGQVVNVTTAAELEAAVLTSALAQNNHIRIAPGTYDIGTANTWTIPPTGICLESTSSTVTDVIITDDVFINSQSPSAPIHIYGVTFSHDSNSAAYNTATGGIPAGFAIMRGQVYVESCVFNRGDAGATAGSVFSFDGKNTSSTCIVINSVAGSDDISKSADIWQVFNGDSTSAYTGCDVIFIGCTGSSAGSGSASNLVTSHNYMKTWVYGGTFSIPGNGPAITAGNHEALIFCIGVFVDRVSGSYYVKIGATTARLTSSVGCHYNGIRGDAVLFITGALQTRFNLTASTDHTVIYPSSSQDVFWSYVGCAFLEAGTSTNGIVFRLEVPRYFVAGCVIRGVINSINIAGSDSASNYQDFWCNEVTALWAVSRDTQTGVQDWLFNLISAPLNPLSASTTKNMKYDGNHSRNSHSAVMSAAASRNSVTPISNRTGAVSGLDTTISVVARPDALSTLDWDFYVADASISAGNQTTLRGRLPIAWGIPSVMGDMVVDSPIACDVGAVAATHLRSGVALYPAVYTTV